MEDEIESIVEDGIAERAFPGAVVLIEKQDRLVCSVVRGDRRIEPSPEPMSADTLFDLASLTKPLATAPLVLHLCAREGIPLDSSLGRFLPEVRPETGELTLLELLVHTSGLPPVPEIYKRFPDATKVDSLEAERALLSCRPTIPPGKQVVYSCSGYQFLGLFLKRVGGLRLSELMRAVATGPCKQDDLLFNPSAADKARSAVTEYCPWRKRWIQGEVHDENSWCLGGDAGNAGLFGTASAVLRWLGLFCRGGMLGDVRLLEESRILLMRSSLTEGLNRRRSVGFAMHDVESPVGPRYSADSFGHTGFTGTSVWVEPRSDLKVVAMTNRVHLGRSDTEPGMGRFRLRLHEAALRAWGVSPAV